MYILCSRHAYYKVIPYNHYNHNDYYYSNEDT